MKSILLAVSILAVFAALTALTFWRAGARAVAAQTAFPPQGQFLMVEGHRVHAVVAGHGPDLVLIHGASGTTRDFSFDLIPALADRYRVIAFDRPGLGYSDSLGDAGLDPREQARVLALAAEQLGVTQPVVLGQSYGGIVALAWAEVRPDNVAALVLVSGVALPWPGDVDPLYRLIDSPFGPPIVPFLAAWVPDSYVRWVIGGIFAPEAVPPGYIDQIGAPLTLRRATLTDNARQVARLRPFVVEMERGYAALTLPIEAVHGTADRTVPAQVHSIPLAARLANVHLDLIEGAGHMPHHTHLDRVIAAIDRAFARVPLHGGAAAP